MSDEDHINEHNNGYNHCVKHDEADAKENYEDSLKRNPFIKLENNEYNKGASCGYEKGYEDTYNTIFNKMYPVLPKQYIINRSWQKTRNS